MMLPFLLNNEINKINNITTIDNILIIIDNI